ncbi:MAG: DPP IV N-terminal domain-containing protein [Prevotella sp.]|nr:DPP IV N-terminal domain-containing protein [Prevotella sp.]
MKARMLAVAVLFGLCSLSSIAQEKKSFTLEDLNFGGTNYRNMIPKTQYYKWWGDELVRIDGKEYYLVDKKSGKETLVRDTEKVNEIKQFQKKNERSFVKDNNFYVVGNQGDTIQLTTDGSREIVYGQSVHRNEFGIDGGTFWSPDGQRVAFYRMDQSKVADYPQVNIKARSAAYEPDKYPMAGEQSHDVTIGIYDLKTGKTIFLETPKSNDTKQLPESGKMDYQAVYFTNVAWSPDSKTIYVFELNRDQNDCRLVSYDAEKGHRLQELDLETSTKYVEPMHPITFLPWDSSKFLFQSQRDGYRHLYLYDLKKGRSTQLTSGKWVVMELMGFNEKAKSVIIASNEISPIQRNLFAVDVKSGRRTLLDNGRGYHSGELSASGQWLRDSYSEPDVPRVIAVTNTQKPSPKTLFTAENPWKDYNVPEYSCGKLKTADGQTDLYYRMVKPVDFDPTKKYPTVIYVYGGPHAHNVDARWHYGSRSWETYMAQKGYLLFILDNRGSENRGRDFEQATFRRLGQVETEDQMQGVKFLQSLPYVDADRIGVHGWSYGGFMTITMMTRHPEIFKVGVAGGPVIDWKWYEVMYGERYMDTPQQNPEGYKEASLIEQAKNLKGKLQIITGYNDDTVVPQHCLSFIYECNKVGTQPDFYVYPLEGHNMRGHQSVHLHERITQYFEDFLK